MSLQIMNASSLKSQSYSTQWRNVINEEIAEFLFPTFHQGYADPFSIFIPKSYLITKNFKI